MLPDGRRIGAHLPLGAGMVKAVDRAHAIGASAIQVFSDNPTAWRRRPGPPKELPAFRARLAELDIGPLAIHASYLVNLAGPDDDFYERSVGLLTHELWMARLYGAQFVNVHIGSHRGTGLDSGVGRLADGAARAFEASTRIAEMEIAAEVSPVPLPGAEASKPTLVLENSAGGGYGIGTTIAELAAIHEQMLSRGLARDRIGFCLDTAHLWGAGYEISDPGVIDDLVVEFDAAIGLDRLVMIHLNDSRAPLGSHLDRHQHLAAGSIGPEGMRHLLRHPRLRHVTYYLETPGMDEGYDELNVRRARDLAAGLDVEQLPPKALKLRGSRARSAPADDG